MGTPMTYDQLRDHLDQIYSDPFTRLDVRLIEKLQAELFASTDPKVSAALLVQISNLLPTIQEDPTPLTNLATKAATYLNYSQIRSIEPPLDILAGIKAPSHPVNLLALSLLRKASESVSDAAVVAGDSALVTSLVEIWLTSTTTAVAEAAFDVLWCLLRIDHPNQPWINGNMESSNSGGLGLVWRRLFGDRNVYNLLFSICCLDNDGQPGQPSKRQKSVAQGRVMDFVTRVGSLDWQAVTTSHFPDVELGFKCKNLLDFAACQMVDTEDVLLHMTLIHFLEDLIKIGAPGFQQRCSTAQVSHPIFSSPSLDFLVSSGLHDRIMKYFVEPSTLDPAEAAYLSGPIMAFLDKILTRTLQSFDMPSVQWAHGAVPSVATANWDVIKQGSTSEGITTARFAIPTEDEVERLGPASQGNLPLHGAWALLVPPALTVVLPYLFKDPQTHANFVAGGRGDTESAVWRIATAKYDALVALESSIERIGGSTNGVEDVIRTMKRRVAQGPWGNTSQIGSRVDALEL
ncbi:hypothetical protein CIHG_02498 [Coccidioides immitis H538.4]|uniref:Uncharacterized protein n=1 Tax=Coccidioides immitis H538.4 TaxID=396776 RepID=A0A0J8RLA3_COCIT|nr:hypothetical protein CIHG_02498 [Coccidioides immitis H538.4]